VVAEAPEVRVPAGYGVHHEWFRVRVAKVGSRIEMDLDGRPVFRYEDPEPLPGGYVGIWSRRNGIMVPRVTVYR
jgi:Txe/YoeB family toxin of Txe-Axe toxin-antitoxin module